MGTTPKRKRASSKWGPCMSSHKKTIILRPMMRTLTAGKCFERIASRIGIMVIYYLNIIFLPFEYKKNYGGSTTNPPIPPLLKGGNGNY
jgi:hypothetical protein